MKLKVRDGHATLNGDKTEHEMPSGSMDIIGQDGKTLFCITLGHAADLQISAHGVLKHDEVLLDDKIGVRPWDSSRVLIVRLPYE